MNELLTYIVQSLVDKLRRGLGDRAQSRRRDRFRGPRRRRRYGQGHRPQGAHRQRDPRPHEGRGPEEGQEGLGRDCRLSPIPQLCGRDNPPAHKHYHGGTKPNTRSSPRRPRRGQDYALDGHARVPARRKTLYIDGRPHKVLASRIHKGALLAQLEGVEDVNAAMRYKGRCVFIDRADAPLPEGGYFIQDISARGSSRSPAGR